MHPVLVPMYNVYLQFQGMFTDLKGEHFQESCL